MWGLTATGANTLAHTYAILLTHIDDAYREWWEHHLHLDPIRGTPLQPTTHEPCLYHGIVAGCLLLLLCQVDDFAIACMDTQIAEGVIKTIESKMTVKVHSLGIITRFHGVDVQQTQYYIKLSMHKYLTKMLMNHGWSLTISSSSTRLPLQPDSNYITSLETANRPTTTDEQGKLKQRNKEYLNCVLHY
jgi:hypothetical protein